MRNIRTASLAVAVTLCGWVGLAPVPAVAAAATSLSAATGSRPASSSPLGVTIRSGAQPTRSAALTSSTTTSGGVTTVVTDFGKNANAFNIIQPATTSIWRGCWGWCGLGSAWANSDPSGVITTSASVFGFATAQADQWLGAQYVAQAPTGTTSQVTITATVFTVDETVGVSGIGASCAPASIYESDFSGVHQNQLASCLSSLSVSIPEYEDGNAAAAAGNSEFLQAVKGYQDASTVQGFLSLLPSFSTSPFSWSGSIAGQSSVGIAVNPDNIVGDSGGGTEAQIMDNWVTVEVTEKYSSGSGGPYAYSGGWAGKTQTLALRPNASVESYPDASQLSQQVTNFQTTDPTYSCLNGKSINVFTAPSEFPDEFVVHDGNQGTMCAYGVWLIPRTYTGGWAGQTRNLALHGNVSVENYSDSTLLSQQVTNFQTTDPTYSCLNGSSINVFTAPKEFPGQYVVHDGLQGTMCAYGAWLMPQSYTGTWLGAAMTISPRANVTVENYSDATLLSQQLQNFQTNDPSYTCLNGNAINVFTAPLEFPGQYIVHDGLQGTMCAYGAWLFPQNYTGSWLGQSIALVPHANASVEGYADATLLSQQLRNFQTTDPSFSCLDGTNLNVFTAPKEFPGQYIVHDGLQGTMCAYGVWLVPQTYAGLFLSQPRTLTQIPNVTVEGFSDATLLTQQLQNFQTTDPNDSCLDGTNLNVFTAPKEFLGQFAVHNGLQGTQCSYGTWLIPMAYHGTWQASNRQLAVHTNLTVEGLPDATLLGQLGNFQTDDPASSCLNGKAINVFSAPSEFPGELVVHDGLQGTMCAYGVWTFHQEYGGTWQGHAAAFELHANVSVSSYSDAKLLGQTSGFQTTDSTYSCLAGGSLNVYNAPTEFPGQFVVNNGAQSGQCATGTWTFHHSYTGGWQGVTVPFSVVANVAVSGYKDATLVGQVTGFLANDPAFNCLNGGSINVYTAPKEFPNLDVVNNGAQSGQCASGTWTFPQTYAAGGWQGQVVPLGAHTNVAVETDADATVVGQVTNFQTNNSTYSCLNGNAINVWTAPSEFPGLYVAHNAGQGTQCATGTWTFSQDWGPAG